MCEYSGRLIAWLDHELTESEATNVEWHVAQCTECRQAAATYAEISSAFLECYESALAPPRRKPRLWAYSAVAAAAASLAAILLIQPRSEFTPLSVPPAATAPAMAFERSPVPVFASNSAEPKPVIRVMARRAPVVVPVRTRIRPEWVAIEPNVEVALPADALFPPGAVPQGFSFIADVHPY